jgi:hypothetical protein
MYLSSNGKVNIAASVISLSICIIALILNFTTNTNFEIFYSIKPITLAQYSGFLSFALLLELVRPKLKLKLKYKNIILAFIFMFVMATSFEMLWSFGYWFSTYELRVMEGAVENSDTLDMINYTPSSQLREYYFYQNRSLNQSAKKNTLFFFMGIYLLWYMMRKDDPIFINPYKEQ